MQVTFFSPVTPDSAKMKSYKSRYGLVAEPAIDAAFYFDLVGKSLAGIQAMKDKNLWPTMEYTKCNDSSSSVTLERNFYLKLSIMVTYMIHYKTTEISPSPRGFTWCPKKNYTGFCLISVQPCIVFSNVFFSPEN